jgi:ribonuclease HII
MPRSHRQPALLELPEPLPARPDRRWEEACGAEGWLRVAGVDEAGRGPLAGPVVAAAVILPAGIELAGLDDSKRLPEEVRERLYGQIIAAAEAWHTAVIEPPEIDRLNILRATHRAMALSLSGLRPLPDGALVDGLPVSGLPCPHRALVQGDRRSLSIAAASVIAKVRRDRLMRELDLQHPGYGFARHKGYGTPEHLAVLERLGPTPCHRRSFAPVARLYAGNPAPPAPALFSLEEE